MAKNSAVNLDITPNADGYSIAGGTTPRTLTITAGNLTLSSGGANTYTFPAATGTLVSRDSTDTLTNKTIAGSTNSVSYNTFTNPYKFSAYRATNYSSGNGAFAKVPFDTENFDTGSNFDTTNNRFVAPVNGFYFFNFNVQSSSLAANLIASIYKNGTELRRFRYNATSVAGSGASGSDLISLNATDYIEVFSLTTTTVTMDGGADRAFLSGFLVSIT